MGKMCPISRKVIGMNHKDIQERMLLYLDGDLPESEDQAIRDHLLHCTLCSRQLKLLAAAWRSEDTSERAQPPPYLWSRIERRMREHEEEQIALPDWREIMKRYVLRPLPALAAVAAVVMGIYIGSLSTGSESWRSRIADQRFEPAEEFGLDQFDLVPPGSLGITLVNGSNSK